ncbi:protein NUCLEAR FUSION DEFECTIVE 4-like [Rhododendron vialii]|uniref:protein NUCLEAR FUSION DEFECTIVE 4-like n=1 Tax=Rhododendron vialii TaxID=182163 RepID=UPI0026600F0D|nr:protein NUCLEAR FUSION DEFECTIVE 4-like [Rhododendron vialii]
MHSTCFINPFSSNLIFPQNSKMALQWLILVGAIWLQSINGTNSNFPAYSSEFKRLLSLSQLQLNNLAFASDAGKLLGFISGVAASHLPLWLVLLIGSVLGLVGYGVQYLFLSDHIPSLTYGSVFLLTILSGNSICWINTVCYMITISTFPFDRHVAVGLTTSYIGLSAEIYTDLVSLFFPSSPSSSSSTETAKAYLLLNSVSPLVVCVFCAPIVWCANNGVSRRLRGGFVVMFVITIGTGIFAVISSFGKIARGLPPFVVVIGIGVFLLAPLVVPMVENVMERFQKKCWLRREGRIYDVGQVEGGGGERAEEGRKEAEESGGGGSCEVVEEVRVTERAEEGREEVVQVEESGGGGERFEAGVEEVGAKEMVKRVEFWLYFLVYLCGATLGLVYLNNLGQIAESRGFRRTSTLVSLSSSFGFFGRLMPSLLAHIFSRSKCMASTPASIAIIMAPMSASFFLLLNKTTLSLYISTAVIGLCTGAITSIAVSTTTELFGAKNFSVNHNIVVANIPVGSFVFGNAAALLYRSKINTEDGRCMGTECYQTTFVIWGFLCLFGSFLSIILYVRTKKMYAQRL